MWKLVRIQFINYLRYIIPLGIFLILYFTEFYEGGRLPVFVFLCFWAFLLTSGSLSTSESYEEKNSGYRILSILPVTDKEIVASKFLMVLAAVSLITLMNVALLFIRIGSSEKPWMMIMIGLLWGVFCLLYGAVMYIGIFKLGYTRMTKYFWTAFLIIIVLMIFFVGDVLSGLKINVESLHHFSKSGLWIVLVAAGIIGYYYLYKYAITVKLQSEEL